MFNKIDESEYLHRQFIRDRNEALLSLDKGKILAYAKKYGAKISDENEEVFWRAIHKARTGITDFPENEKQKSKDWLAAHNSQHWDDKP